MTDRNPVFNNQLTVNSNTAYFATNNVKKKIVQQLAGKTPAQQEAIIEALLKLLDINLLAALNLAYDVAPEPDSAEQ